MNRFLLIMIVALTVSCSGISNPRSSGLNPFEYCKQQGLGEATDQYNQCVADYIEKQCTAEGQEPGTEAYRKCEANLGNAAFVRDQMQIRGF